jgi:hypothetical protein
MRGSAAQYNGVAASGPNPLASSANHHHSRPVKQFPPWRDATTMTPPASTGANHPFQRVWSLADMPQVCRYTAHARASHLRECSTARPTQKKGMK